MRRLLDIGSTRIATGIASLAAIALCVLLISEKSRSRRLQSLLATSGVSDIVALEIIANGSPDELKNHIASNLKLVLFEAERENLTNPFIQQFVIRAIERADELSLCQAEMSRLTAYATHLRNRLGTGIAEY